MGAYDCVTHGIVSLYANPLTIGHIDMIEAASARCDTLWAIVNNDHQQQLKIGGIHMDEDKRLRIVSSIKGVDHAILAVDKNPDISETLQVILSKYIAKNGRYQQREILFFNSGDRTTPDPLETKVCEDLGIQMVFLDQPKVDSSSNYRNLK
jgi:bifunctional ADP-heptose synthase (sugar kinase/adenylyltransferase)